MKHSFFAFPSDESYGMDMRDYFAAAIVTQLINHKDFKHNDSEEDMCRHAYTIAEFMMRAREE